MIRRFFTVSVICILAVTLCACVAPSPPPADNNNPPSSDTSGAQESDSSSPSKPTSSESTPWPSGAAAQAIPQYTGGGSIAHTTDTAASDFIMITDVSKEEAMAYWDQAQAAGFTNITSKTEPTQFYDGFTYVADNGQGVSLSVTWAPGEPDTLTLLAIKA